MISDRDTPAAFTLERIAAGPKTQVVAAGGGIALLESRRLEHAVVDGVRQGRTRVVVDLSRVDQVGPGLLGALLRIRRGLTRVNGSVAVVVGGPPVSDLVEATVLAALIDVEADREHALARVDAGRRR